MICKKPIRIRRKALAIDRNWPACEILQDIVGSILAVLDAIIEGFDDRAVSY